MKKDKRGQFWKKISKEERSKEMSRRVSSRWAKTSKEERSKHATNLNNIRWGKNLSTQ